MCRYRRIAGEVSGIIKYMLMEWSGVPYGTVSKERLVNYRGRLCGAWEHVPIDPLTCTRLELSATGLLKAPPRPYGSPNSFHKKLQYFLLPMKV